MTSLSGKGATALIYKKEKAQSIFAIVINKTKKFIRGKVLIRNLFKNGT